MKTRILLSFLLAGVLLVNCKKDKEPEVVAPIQITSPTDGAFVHDSVPVIFNYDHTLNIIRTECYVDFDLLEAFDSIPAKIWFNAAQFGKGTTHQYYLRIITKDGHTSNSNVITLVISQLTRPAVTVTFLSKTSLRLTWPDQSNNETGYQVKRKVGNGNYVVVANLLPATTSFTDNTLDTTQSYTYLVTAFSADDMIESDPVIVAYFLDRYHFVHEYDVPSAVEGKIVISPDVQKVVVTNYWEDNFTVINTINGNKTSLPQDGGTLGLCMSHNGTFFITGGTHDYDLVKVWDLNTLSLIRQFQVGSANYALGTNNTDEQLVAGGEPVKIYNVGDGSLVSTYAVTNAYCRSVQFSGSETELLTGGNDDLVKLYDVNTGQLIRTYTGHSGHVGAAIFSDDESRIISGSYEENRVLIWETNTGSIMKTITMSSPTVSICKGRNGDCIVASRNGTISVMAPDGSVKQVWKEFSFLLSIDFNKTHDVIAAYGSSPALMVKLFDKTGHWERI